jgi:hypothetical protein
MSHTDPDPGQGRREVSDGFWADLRRDYASMWPTVLREMRSAREQWRELTAQIRQDRQLTRRMKQRATGEKNPTRRQWRKASRAFAVEAREIEEAERRTLREFGEDQS